MVWVVCEDVVVQFSVYDGCIVFLKAAAGTVGGEGGLVLILAGAVCNVWKFFWYKSTHA